MPEAFSPTRAPGIATPASPLEANSLPTSPLLPERDDDPDPLETEFKAGLPRHEVVESSQSQYENEISSEWADVMAARKANLSGPRYEDDKDMVPSSPTRPIRSQDYDANDEYSQSQDACSEPSTFGPSGPHTSPLRPVSQYTDSTDSYNPTPYPITPSQVRRFVNMFENRDESGNELPGFEEDDRSRSVSPSPTSRRTPRNRATSSPRSYTLEDTSLRAGIRAGATRETGRHDGPDRNDPDLSSSSQDYPMPVQDLLRIFEDRHTSS
ncbi:hypothetical protein GY45DRAFT_1299022 [Cubamyces sp. BRFM 1775]|nr:hypothetical protein GY45DRAFT_1299022 [Cubamyces sp. BRFM 1775]